MCLLCFVIFLKNLIPLVDLQNVGIMRRISTIYTLNLLEGKFYVGHSKNFNQRLLQHIGGRGAEWTKKYPVQAIHNKFLCSDDKAVCMETKETCMLMLMHGINNVRGGPWTSLRLFTKNDLNELTSHIGHNLDMPYKTIREQLNKFNFP